MIRQCFLIAALLTTGCSQSADAILVRGSLALDGEPLRDAAVLLWPKADLSAGTATSRVEDDGSFILATLPDRCPLKPGSYVLVIRQLNGAAKPQPGRKPGPVLTADLGHYSSKTESPLIVTIDHGVNELGMMELAQTDSRKR